MIFPPQNKDCALFDEPIGDLYDTPHRPGSPPLGGNYIWLAEPPDLLHWGNHSCVARTREGQWDRTRVGAGASPHRSPHGWLEIYHGATEQNRYCLGTLLLDLNEPLRVLARSEKTIVEPVDGYEQEGFVGHVIFTIGHLVEGDKLTLDYRADDIPPGCCFPVWP